MSQNLFRITVRFNLKDPEHAEIVKVLKDLNRSKYTTMTAFAIDAIKYYIRALSDDTLTNAGKRELELRSSDLVTNKDLEHRLAAYDKDIRLFIYETVLGSKAVPSIITPQETIKPTDPPESDEIDLTRCDSIMKDMNHWIDQ